MKTSKYRKIKSLLEKVYKELETEGIASGMNVMSDDFTTVLAKARDLVLERSGVTLEEFNEASLKDDPEAKEDMVEDLHEQVKSIKEELKNVLTEDDVVNIATEVAKRFIVPPVVKHEIVKETTVEQPRIVETVRNITVKEEYNDKPLKKDIQRIESKVDGIKIPEVDTSVFLRKDEFAENFEHNIDTLGMPDFRKLGMGLQQQIDEKQALITFSTTAPTGNLYLNRLWVDLS